MKYVAEDGTIFTCEKDCREYEDNIDPITNHFVLYDKDLEVQTITDINDFPSFEYIYIMSEPDRVVEYIQRYGVYSVGITDCGIYTYDDSCGESWYKIDDIIKYYKNKADSLEAIKTGILQAQANRESGYNVY